jgi:PKHD-type hydroxylase
MIYKNNYFYFDKALPSHLCEDIIKLGNAQKESIAATGGIVVDKSSKEDLDNMKKKRNSNITWLEEQWLYDIIDHYVKEANKEAGWNVDVNWYESIQFTKYKLNQHYCWHQDAWAEPYKDEAHENFKGKIRKLSCIIALSDPKDYKGGDLQFSFYNNSPDQKNEIHTCKKIKPQGSIVVFPSYIFHRVKPVIKGTRYSLVAWGLGYPYK